MRSVATLIDEAASKVGGDRRLADRTGLHPSEISDMRRGQKPLSPERVGLLCDVLELDGEEARRLLAEAVVLNAKSPTRKEVLRRAFFVSWALGVVVLATPTPAQSRVIADFVKFTVYTLSRIHPRAWTRARGWRTGAIRGCAPDTPGGKPPASRRPPADQAEPARRWLYDACPLKLFPRHDAIIGWQ